MNFLAHSLIADQGNDIGRIGGILGDLLKSGEGLPTEVQREMRVHRAVDSYTDAHEIVLSTKALFRKETRRFAGILLDIFYDYCLSADWASYSAEPLSALIKRTHSDLLACRGAYPASVVAIVERMVSERLLASYQTLAGVERAIIRTSKRLSKGGEMMVAGIDDLQRNQAAIALGFSQFFPELLEYSKRKRADLLAEQGG